jgi:ATP-dependent helicase Lhr and Lhr-like helicase
VNPEELRSRLPRTWGAILARHGSPNAVQLAASGPMLEGRDTLVCAPTASGKTEAWLAPLVERHVPATWEGEPTCRMIVVSPTRALVNDLHRRITPFLAQMGVECGRWTGDYHDQGRLHAVTVLTPEGLDSRLSRARARLGDVRAIVLDELHVLDDSARGDQLRVLLGRLRHHQQVQAVAASATVGDADGMAARYLDNAVVVDVGERRRILARIVVAEGTTELRRELERAVDRGFRKILAFVPSREDVEVYVSALKGWPPFGNDVLAHHGSLARGERLRTEQQFLSRPAALCFATTTLELGIDIGDIDLIAVVGPPADVSSLVQRAGRGGRRTSRNPLLAVARSPFEAEVYRVMLRAAARGDLLLPPARFRPGVLVQQAVSLLHENPSRWVSAAALRSRLPVELREDWPKERLERILSSAAERRLLERSGRVFTLGERGERLWARAKLHANLKDQGGVTVRDALTGETLGMVAEADTPSLSIAGRGRQVLRASDGNVVTRAFGSASLARFTPGGRPSTAGPLSRKILEEVGISVPSRTCLDGAVLFHGLGTGGGRLLGKAFEVAGVEVWRAGPLAVILGALPAIWPGPDAADQALKRYHAQLARTLDLGAFHHDLPIDEQRKATAEATDLAGVKAFLTAGEPPLSVHPFEEDAAWWG